LKIDEITWNLNGDDLTPTVADDLVAIGKSRKQHATASRNIRFATDVVPGLEPPNGGG
jgi:hypothetical protein